MKRRIVRIAKAACFLLVFLVAYYFVSSTLKFKYEDGIRPMENYYALPEDTVDVLLLGSSHMGMNVNPGQMWDEQGIAAYSCWGSIQPMWNTYYYLKECLKTQTPKLVVMDTFTAGLDFEYSDYERIVTNTLGMRPSRDKLEAIRVSAPPEDAISVLLGFPTYHYRYSDLTFADFQYYFWQKDTSLHDLNTSDTVYPIEILPPSRRAEELNEKCRDYLIKIIELCQEREIPLLLVASPYELSELEQRRQNWIRRYADENGLVFLNLNDNYQEAGIDPRTDFMDVGHLNNGGIRKYTAYLTDYISTHYDLPDRREDPEHIWNRPREVKGNSDPGTFERIFNRVDGWFDRFFSDPRQSGGGEENQGIPMADASPVYAMEKQFQGSGLDYLDTGIALYNNPYASYTLLTQIDTTCEGGDMVYLSCFAEEEGNYRGLLIRKEDDGQIHVVFSTALSQTLKVSGDVMTLAVVKDGLRYRLYADGELVWNFSTEAFDPYAGTLVLGCELDANGEPFRMSDVRVRDLVVYDAALVEEDILRWEPTPHAEPEFERAGAAGAEADYELPYRFTDSALDEFVDTGVSLYDAPEKSWTVLAQFREGDDFGSGVYFSCFAEEEGSYRGLLVRRARPGWINIMYGSHGQDIEVGVGADVRIAFVKERFAYTVYVNGVKRVDGEKVPVRAYDGHLLVGAQETPEGEKMRFSAVTVYNLEYYSGVMSEENILNWGPEFRPLAKKSSGTPVEYQLDSPFLGDGSAKYIDTGVQLYDAGDKDWSLTMTFERNGDSVGILASCFAEIPGSYRGLLVKLTDAETLSVTMGKMAQTLGLSREPEQTLQIVKRGYEYTVYLNGEPAGAPVESRAPAFDGTLRIGCQTREDGTPFHFSSAKILALSVE